MFFTSFGPSPRTADVDADAKVEPLPHRRARIALGHGALHFDRTSYGVDHAREFDEQAVTGGLDDAACVLGDLGIDELAPMRLERRERAALVRAHQPGIPDNVEGDDGRQSSLITRHPSSLGKRLRSRHDIDAARGAQIAWQSGRVKESVR